MRYKYLIAAIFACITVSQLKAQDLYIPRDVKHAYAKDTRAHDGRPGNHYWQNHATYNIHITVLPPDRTVYGSEQITYVNNSPDTLKQLNMKLIMNIHRSSVTRFRSTTPDYITPGMQIDTIAINRQLQKWNNAENLGTNQMVELPAPLMPHDSVKLNIAFHYQLATGEGREGVIDSTTFYIAYFYPRIAVYDDYNGWDKLEFNDRQEFYNDFNNYTLSVTVPENYIVWATGTLQNAAQVLQPKFANRLQHSLTADSVVRIVTPADNAAHNVTAQNKLNTWIWKADDISDVAVGLSDHYNWDGASAIVDHITGRRAAMQSAYNDTAKDFHQAVKFGLHEFDFYSHNWPGVPYPFPKMTAFQGYASMEFPMMVNDDHINDMVSAQLLQDHEVAHTYFPFYMGINETRYGYMDEGWATTFELFINESEIGKKAALERYRHNRIAPYITDPSSSEDLPIITPTSELVGGYAHNAYGKASLSYLALKDLLGDALFKKALHFYMDMWHGKHPIPWDYFNCMNTGSGKNLNWFFNNWFFTYNYIDLAIENVVKNKTGYNLSVKNIGGYAVPYDVILTYADGTTETLHQTPATWEHNQKEASIQFKTKKAIGSVTLDGGIFMDADPSNNTWHTK